MRENDTLIIRTEATPAPEQPEVQEAAPIAEVPDNDESGMTKEQVTVYLANCGLRVAIEGETGWYWRYVDSEGIGRSLWVTDEPAPVEAEAPADVSPYAVVCDFDSEVRYLTEQGAADLRAYLANEGVKTDTYTEVLPIPEWAAARIQQAKEDAAFVEMLERQAEQDENYGPVYDDDSFVVTPPSGEDAWDEEAMSRYCNEELWRQRGRRLQLSIHRTPVRGWRKGQGYRNRAEWDMWERDVEDFAHNPYRG